MNKSFVSLCDVSQCSQGQEQVVCKSTLIFVNKVMNKSFVSLH